MLGLTPARCVVVDDPRTNVLGAVAAGTVAGHHRDPQTTLAEVEFLLDLPPRAR